VANWQTDGLGEEWETKGSKDSTHEHFPGKEQGNVTLGAHANRAVGKVKGGSSLLGDLLPTTGSHVGSAEESPRPTKSGEY